VNIHPWPSDRHLTVDYSVSSTPRYGATVPPHAPMKSLLDASRPLFASIINDLAANKPLLDSVGAERSDADALAPCWNNGWFPPLDAAVLMHLLTTQKPRRYVEIGSGNSTLFARHAIDFAGLATTITSIDPQPRRGIDRLCTEVIRSPLERTDLAVFDELEAGDILFFDGSHRVFTDSDVTVFFLEVLPRVKVGTLVHVHDIFWPVDYPREWGQRFYSEQYMLAMLFLYAPEKFETLFASAYVSLDTELSDQVANLTPGNSFFGFYGMSYWFRQVSGSSRAFAPHLS